VNYFLRRPISFIPPLGPPKASARQRVLAQWRRVDLEPLEVAGRPPKATPDVMKRVLRDIRIECRQQEAEIVRVWNQLLPPDIVAHAQPAGVAKGTLFVNVDSSAWLSEIVRWRKREILERLQHSFGRKLIARISFRLG
jgi:Dna[CI] antecedent DciA-like protein